METRRDGDPLDPQAWTKFPRPILQATERTWGVGHCSFTQSPDGTEDWIAFHAKLETTPNWKRAIHVQRFHWDDEGRPVFGQPIAAGEALAVPAGEAVTPAFAETVAFGRAALAAAMGETPMVESVTVVEPAGR